MLLTSITILALAAGARAAPVLEATKTVQGRQFSWGDPSTWFGSGSTQPTPEPTMIILPPIVGGIHPSDKRATSTLRERQFSWGDPSTWFGSGNEQPPAPTTSILPPITGGLNPPDKRQDDTIGLGGSAPDPTQAKIQGLELEFETLLHQFGSHAPWPVEQRLKAIKEELLKYGITIVESPDGTTTTFVPGKRGIEDIVPRGPFIPSEFTPGGPLIADPSVPGGPIQVSN
ncbi:hypothetical protein F5X96DRAFT_645124 [Biscogniauxia mediterranea]|nr:hypothetical protein F5X96DRAFT_645124 [Biscogniauxia mediterranea]